MSLLRKMFGLEPKANFAELKQQGAIILDVRTKGEFNSGHIKGAVNISVDALENNLSRLKDKQKPIITCCASGMRSAAAKRMLKANGYTNVHNGGAWLSLQHKL